LINSRYPRFSATPQSSRREVFHSKGHTFSRSYGVNLPSSLTRVLSSALGYSPHPPVSVSGTVTTAINSCEAFPGSLESPSCRLLKGANLIASRHCQRVCGLRLLRQLPTSLNHHPLGGSAILLRPSSRNDPWWCRNIHLLPISYAFQPRLRGRLTLGRLS
jgi:hypothetical protein